MLYTVTKGEKVIINRAPISLSLKGYDTICNGLTVKATSKVDIRESWICPWGKRKNVEDFYNLLKIECANEAYGIDINFYLRAYNDGVAFRYEIPAQDSITEFELTEEKTLYPFADNYKSWAANFERYTSPQEKHYDLRNLAEIEDTVLFGLPVLVDIGDEDFVAVTEANLTDWAGMYLKKAEGPALVSCLSPRKDDGSILVKTKAPRKSPWRVLLIGKMADLVESDMVINLNDINALGDIDWVKPGISSWDWWWPNRYSPDVDFKLGPNQETMKHFIDLSAEMGWEYQLVDWQWYGEPFTKMPVANLEADITTPIEGINIEELVKYGKSKNVGILVWLHWDNTMRQMDEAFPLYEKWGVKGVKIDFLNRDDQQMVQNYHKIVKKAAEHHLMVNFHGAYKPTGVSRTYPNLVTREGVLGNEFNKWSTKVTLEHKVTLPFTRGLLGEMDFTPGSFVNVHPENFKTERKVPSPMSMGTRCNQLAMNVVYESVLTVMCDAPYNYRNSPAGVDFLKKVPTTWDDTKFISGYPGEYVCMARKSKNEWYIGGMNNEEPREIAFTLDFIEGETPVQLKVWKDSPDCEQEPTLVQYEEIEMAVSDTLKLKMERGGGFVMIASAK